MFSAIRASTLRSSPLRSFSTSAARRWDVARLTLVGTLVREPEVRTTRSEKEYVMYTVATNSYPPGPPGEDGRPTSNSTFHRVLSFNEASNRYLQTLKKGTKVMVEADYQVREPEPGADPTSARGQRQIFLKQEFVRVLNPPRHREPEPESHEGINETEHF
ncbi:hypothetical protein FA13DRAFT_1811110 [Coprinellus micaceus]|uniref:Nucleic acid-binding protein n=1 Tax=Coprinellus micaceus TaxID=71717 RepID=A0A4Y7TP99_COPMI|nr:hypothetical protein FA13DRAFT_1811110 [Coprinellus micaceus]